jgi:hypothetical protein
MARWRKPVSGSRVTVGDGAANLGSDLLVKWSGIVAV